MSTEYLISGMCKVSACENYSKTHSIKAGLMSSFYVSGKYFMCKVIQGSTELKPGEEGDIKVSLVVMNSDYRPKYGDNFELREGKNILAKCRIDSVEFINLR